MTNGVKGLDKTDYQKKRLTFILGMHRSGTSLITKAVQVAGVDLGDNLLPPGPDNPTGFWEDADVMQLKRYLIECARSALGYTQCTTIS